MAKNKETPTGATVRASEIVCLAADDFEIAPPASKIQQNHIGRRFCLPPATAAAVAALAFPLIDTWRARA